MNCRFFLAFAVLCATPAGAKDLIRCTTPGREEAVISLNDHQLGRRAVDCLTADFTAGLSPCAPPSGYGLMSVNGQSGPTRFVTRLTDYADLTATVVGHYTTAAKLAFFGGLQQAGKGYREDWVFIINRQNGIATLTERDKGAVTYLCSADKQRF